MSNRYIINLLFWLLLTFCSCDTPSKEQEGQEQTLTSEKWTYDNAQGTGNTNAEQAQTPKPSPPVDMIKLKNHSFLTTTSGVVPQESVSEFCSSDSSGFFGFYTLIRKSDYGYIGELTIHTNDSPKKWNNDTKNESFAQLKLESPDIMLWDSIGVGTKVKDLLGFIGENFHYTKGTTLHADLGEYSANFILLGDTVNKLTVTQKCD